MIDDEALRVMVHHAIDMDAARYRTRHVTAGLRETWAAEGAWSTYLECITLALGGRYPFGRLADDASVTAAWRTLLQAVDRVLHQAASPLQEPDYDTAVRTLRDLAPTGRRRVRPLPSVASGTADPAAAGGDRSRTAAEHGPITPGTGHDAPPATPTAGAARPAPPPIPDSDDRVRS